jgi:acetate kinase
MKILVINAGSSSIKYQLIEMPAQNVLCNGMIDRIGLDTSNLTYTTPNNKVEESATIPDHKTGLEKVAAFLMDKEIGVIKNADEITAVGHRVVHGGSLFTNTVLINEEVKNQIKELFDLAPLHNPANLEGINVSSTIFRKAQQIAVFDTAFHQTIPPVAHQYALPNYLLKENKIRMYGFHGTSHKYVSEKAIEYLNQTSATKSSKIITIHLGNGCSMTAINDGKSIDHSLGFGPMNGLLMGTRSGDVDQSIIFYLVNTLKYSLNDVNNLLQKQSGMLGLTGYSDLRDIEMHANDGNLECQLALAMNAYRIKKYIGSYAAILNGLDAIVFTAGIGENSAHMRKLACTDMSYFGIELDDSKNEIQSKNIREINTENSKTKILVIPTNEEIEIANQVYALISN